MNTQKIMITGANGFVGRRAIEHFSQAVCVPKELVRNPDEKLMDFVRLNNPDVILNAAAISDIGTCEKNPDESYIANVKLPLILSTASKVVNAKFVSFSSDQVYTGCLIDGPYLEDDDLKTPQNVYARHKLEAEKRVLEINNDAVMLRATWMYDMPVFSHNNRGNFFVNTINSIIKREKISASKNVYRGITYVRQVVDFMDLVFKLPGGVYNYGSENNIDMYDTVFEFFRALGLEKLGEELIEESTQPKRHNLWMNCEKIRKYGIEFDTTKDGFIRCLNDYKVG